MRWYLVMLVKEGVKVNPPSFHRDSKHGRGKRHASFLPPTYTYMYAALLSFHHFSPFSLTSLHVTLINDASVYIWFA